MLKASNWLTHPEYDWESPVWRHWIRFLAENFRIVRFDERGCGMTDWDVDDHSLERWVQDLEEVADAITPKEPMILLGISQGAAVCIDYAVRHPERQIGWFNELCRTTTSPEAAARLLEVRGQIDVTHLLSRVRTPTLVLHARKDRVSSLDEGRRLAAGIPGAQFVELDSRNHILLEDEPAWGRFREALLDFVGIAAPHGEDSAFASLSCREREILVLVTEGLGNAAIADTARPQREDRTQPRLEHARPARRMDGCSSHRVRSRSRLSSLRVRQCATVRPAMVEPVARHSALVRVTHWVSALSFLVLVLSGIAILLAHPRLYWGESGAVGGPSLIDLPLPFVLEVPIRGPGRYLHFLFAWVTVFTGLVYVSMGLVARHFGRNLLPARDEITVSAVGRVIRKHLRFERSSEAELATYNVLQRLSYTTVVFVLLPLMIWTGLAMSPAATSVFPFLAAALHGQQTARTVHFFVACALVLFLFIHVAMVWQTGFRRRMRAMITGRGPAVAEATAGVGFSRRELIKTGLGALAGVGALGAGVRLANRCGLIPANHRGIYGLSETLTYAGQRLLTKLPSMAREFDRSQISTVIPVNGKAPTAEPYQRLMAGGFADWRLRIEGMVARPSSLSLAELKGFPSRSHITHQACEEGWSFIAEWTGVPLSYVLEQAGIHPEARYVFFFTFDDWWDSIDMDDALHPQTLLAYGMNGPELPVDHGAPLRLKVARQLGYKNLKYLSRIMVSDSAKGIGDGLGSGSPAAGYSWYAGI